MLESPVFKNGELLPEKYTCSGSDVNPPLFIKSFHPLSKSLCLIMEDKDALFGFSIHWIVWNIPSETFEIAEGVLPNGAVAGVNSFKKNKYCGPCPRWGGEHRYLFTVYSLDTKLDLSLSSGMRELEEKLTNHLLDEGKLLVRYRQKRESSSNNFFDSI
jgi:Raf kinase inhibitor-like YbhB/YbcL family protein